MNLPAIHANMPSVYQDTQGLSFTPRVNRAADDDGGVPGVDTGQEEGVSPETAAVQASEGSGNSSFIDAAIEQIKKQIEAVEAQLKELESMEGKAALSQKKMLNEQLLALNSQLMELMAQKAGEIA